MAKKPKETRDENPNSSASPSSDNIFKSLFGATQEQPNNPTSVSMFSYSNPVDDSQSIPQKLQQLLRLHADGPPKIDTNIPEYPDNKLNKRKRKEKSPDSIDSDDSEVEGEIKKLKRGNALVSEGSNLVEEEKKHKKKRKRLEVEAESEERKYGVVMDLDLKEGEDGAEGEKVEIGKKRKKLDRGEDMLVSKEGFDDEEKLLRTVFVGNLPLKVKKKELLREFGQFGDIESVWIRSIPLLDDKTPRKGAIIKKQVNDAVDRVNAYIVFKTEESAQASFSHNMAVVGGNHIHVDRACAPRKKLKGENVPPYDSKRTVYIDNLPFDVKDEELYHLFTCHILICQDEELYHLFTGIHNLKDGIEAVPVVRDPATSMGKGIAYVFFKTREAANTVVRKHKLKIQDRELRLSCVIKSNLTSSKRKDSPSANNYNSLNKKLAVGIGDSKSGGQTCGKVVKREKRPSVANAMRSGDGGKRRRPESHVHVTQGDNRNKKARKL